MKKVVSWIMFVGLVISMIVLSKYSSSFASSNANQSEGNDQIQAMDKNKADHNYSGQQPNTGHHASHDELNKKPSGLFENSTIGNGADPWIVSHSDGYYYYTHTTGNNITIWKSKTITGLQDAESKVVWTPEPGAPNSAHIWAPEIHFIDGKWYVYFAASAGDMEEQRMYVIESETSDPYSDYSYPEGTTYGKITTPDDKWSIDGTILELGGQYYFAWSGWEGDVNIRQDIYISKMTNPWTTTGERVELSRPDFDWEKIGEPHVNEGPQFITNKDGQVFLIYSASGSWTDDYKLGMLEFTGSDPLDPNAWEKHSEPVFEKDPDVSVFGPGHNGFFKSPDGTEDWIIYHAPKFQGAGWDRNVRMQKFTWNDDGTPNFGNPIPTGTFLKVPSGEQTGTDSSALTDTLTPALPVGFKYEAEDATVNRANVVYNTGASNGAKVGMIDFEDSFVEFDVDVPAGNYTLKVRFGNGMGHQSSHNVSVNDEPVGEVIYNSYGWDSWNFAEKDITLSNKENKIKIAKGTSFAELDFIELIPKQPTYKYEAEHAIISNAQIKNTFEASNNQKVNFLKEDSYLKYRFDMKKSDTYKLSITYNNPTDQVSTQKLIINNNEVTELEFPPTNSMMKSVSLLIELEDGIQTIKLLHQSGSLNIDYIQLLK